MAGSHTGTSETYSSITSGNITISGNSIVSDNSNGDINISPNGTGTVVINTDIDFDNININGNTISSTSGGITLAPLSGQQITIDIDGNAIGLDIDTEATTVDVVNIQANTITTAKVIDIVDASALTTGSFIAATTSSTTRTSGSLVSITATGNSAGANTGDLMTLSSSDTDTGARSVLSVTQSAGAATGMVGLTLAQASTAKAAFVNQDGNGISIDIDSEATTADVINIDSASTTGITIDINSEATTEGVIVDIADATITTGSALKIACTSTAKTSGAMVDISHVGNSAGANTGDLVTLTMNDSDTGARNVLSLVQEHASATGAIGLSVRQDSTGNTVFLNVDGNAIGLNIDSEGTTADVINIDSANTSGIIVDINSEATDAGGIIDISDATITTGYALKIACTSTAKTSGSLVDISHVGNSVGANTGDLATLTMNDADTGARSVLSIIQEHASATGAVGVTVRQDSTANGVFIDQDGVGIALNIDTEATTTDAINVDADAITTGVVARLASNSSDITARNLVEIINDNTAATGVTPLMIQQDAVTSTNFKKIMTVGGVTIWISDGTTGNGNLSATAGDFLLNGASSKPEFCTGTTNWTAVA